jgi:hypothetical protein
MTTMQYVRELYQLAKQRHGENAPGTQSLKRQLNSMERTWVHDRPGRSTFMVGSARQRPESEKLDVKSPQ